MTIKEQIKQKEAELVQLKKQLDTDYKRIQSFEDACEDQDIASTENRFRFFANCDNSTAAFERLKVIRNALLGDVRLKWKNDGPLKHFPLFDLNKSPRSGFVHSYCSTYNSRTEVSSRLLLDCRETTVYFGNQFEDIWYEYMVENEK